MEKREGIPPAADCDDQITTKHMYIRKYTFLPMDCKWVKAIHCQPIASNNEGYKFLKKLWRCKGGEVKPEIRVSNEVIKGQELPP